MKRLLSAFFVALLAFTLFAVTPQVQAADELIDLYPNGDQANLEGQYGNSNWKLDFLGRRYHTVDFMAKFVSEFSTPAAGEPYTSANMIPHMRANAMGGFIHNDTTTDIELLQGDRTQLGGGAINRVWVWFDEEGRLVQFEDHISAYHMVQVEDEDYYRLATEAEIAAFDADPDTSPVRHTHIRIVLDADGLGYKAEPLGKEKWTNADYVPAGTDPETGDPVLEQGLPSIILPADQDVNAVVIPAGYTVLHISTWDRGVADIYTNWAMTFPEVLADVATTERMELNYIDPKPLLLGFNTLDDNSIAEGVNIVVEYGSVVSSTTFTNGLNAIHKNEADSKDGNFTLAGKHAKVDYKVEIFTLEDELIDTVDMVWNSETDKYDPSKAEVAVSSKDFGAQFKAVYTASSPEGNVGIWEASVDVGVLPININGVKNVTIDQGMPIELLAGITADDAYGNDISASLVTDPLPQLNTYAAQIGTYNVTVRASYLYTQDLGGETAKLTYEGETFEFDPARVNTVAPTLGWGVRHPVVAGTKASFDAQVGHINAAALLYQFNAMYLNTNNEVVAFYRNYDVAPSTPLVLNQGATEPVALTGGGNQATRAAWLKTLKWQDGYKLVFHANAYDTVSDVVHAVFANITTLETVDLTGVPFQTMVHADRTYTLKVRDIQPPQIRALTKEFIVYTDNNYASTLEAVLSNVVATDNHGAPNLFAPAAAGIDLKVPGQHEVNVIAADTEGNVSNVTFTLKVVERATQPAVENEIDELNDQLTDANNKVEELEAELETANGKVTELENKTNASDAKIAELEQAIEDKPTGTSLVVTIIIAVVAAGLSFGGAVLLVKKP